MEINPVAVLRNSRALGPPGRFLLLPGRQQERNMGGISLSPSTPKALPDSLGLGRDIPPGQAVLSMPFMGWASGCGHWGTLGCSGYRELWSGLLSTLKSWALLFPGL